MEREELTQQFSPLQIGVFNSALDAAIRKAKLFIGELIPAEKQAVIEELEQLKIEMPARQECAWCGSPIKPAATYTHPFLSKLYGYSYCSEQCVESHIESK